MVEEFDPLYTATEAATRLKVSSSLLAKLRVSGGGPRFVKIGRSVRYTQSGLRDYQKARTRGSTSER